MKIANSNSLVAAPRCSNCRKPLNREKCNFRMIDSRPYCQHCDSSGRVDITNDPRFAVKSFAELSLWDWHDICIRLTGFAIACMSGRVSEAMQITIGRHLVKATVEATIDGRLAWSPEADGNLLGWLSNRVRKEVNEIMPQRRHRGGRSLKVADEGQAQTRRSRRSRRMASINPRAESMEVSFDSVREVFGESIFEVECLGVG